MAIGNFSEEGYEVTLKQQGNGHSTQSTKSWGDPFMRDEVPTTHKGIVRDVDNEHPTKKGTHNFNGMSEWIAKNLARLSRGKCVFEWKIRSLFAQFYNVGSVFIATKRSRVCIRYDLGRIKLNEGDGSNPDEISRSVISLPLTFSGCANKIK